MEVIEIISSYVNKSNNILKVEFQMLNNDNITSDTIKVILCSSTPKKTGFLRKIFPNNLLIILTIEEPCGFSSLLCCVKLPDITINISNCILRQVSYQEKLHNIHLKMILTFPHR